jgi:Big-like domain-containing protein
MLGAGVAAMALVAGTIGALDAAEIVVGTTPTAADSSCQDTWTGAAGTTDWNTATNWSTGVPDSTSVHACITGHVTVLLGDASLSVGELTVSAGSSLTIGTGGTGATSASLHVSSGAENDGTLTVPSGNADSGLTLDGPVTNTGTLTVAGTVTVGATVATTLTNDGTVGVAPGGLLTMGASSTITNESDGLLAFGVDGPPTSTPDYGRIADGMLSLAGSADLVFDNGFTPAPGSDYVVDTGASTGAFTTVLHNAAADYSHTGEVGLTGGAPATATSTSLTSSAPSGSPYGQGVQLTATVTPSSGSEPSGFVTFSGDGRVLADAPVATDAGVTTATLDVSSLPIGSQSITASYGGDVRFGASASPALTQVVNPDPTSVAITPSSSTVEPDQPVTYTATIGSSASGTPTGAVSFTDDGSPIPGCQSLAVPPSAPLQVTCTESSGSIATHSIVATYGGDTDFLSATGVLAEHVAPMSTTATVVVSPPAPTYGQSVTLTSTVAPTSGTTDPAGIVTFTVNGTTLGSSVLSTTGGVTSASMLVTTLPVGSDFVTASYDAAAGFVDSSSATAAHVVVSKAPTSLGLLTSSNPSPFAQPVTFTATIFPTTGSGETGTVTFFDNGTVVGTCAVSNGQATLSATGLPVGTDPVTASYGGDGDFVGSVTAGALPQAVDRPHAM